MSIVESIKARLMNRARNENRTFQEILTIYGLERALYRLSISPFSSHFILKGGVLLYALYQGNFTRGTTDVDLLGHHIAHNTETIRDAFLSVFKIEDLSDGIEFDTSTLRADKINESRKYPGINLAIDGYLGRTKVVVNIDVGFGDVIYPKQVEMEYPTLLNHLPPIIQVYSIESIIAEKFEAIVSLGKANSRMKDFYDIYALSRSSNFDAETLKEAIQETFTNRNTDLHTIVAFEQGFSSDSYRKGMWTSFLKAKGIIIPLNFDYVVTNIKSFLTPLIQAIHHETHLKGFWNYRVAEWAMSSID